MQCQLPAPRESTVSLPRFKESCSSMVTFESFHYLSARISGAHSGLLTCPCLTALLTFGCLRSANQVVAEMCIVPLKSFWFSQVPLQFFWRNIWQCYVYLKKPLHHMFIQLLTIPRQKFFPVIAHLLTKEIILFMYSGTLPWYLTCLIM